MNIIRAVLITIVVVWLQLATLPAIRPLGIVPNLALVVIVLLAVRLPLSTSLGIALAIGWLLDLGSGSDYGLRTSFYLLLALAVAVLRQFGSDLENFSLQASVVGAATVLINLAILGNLALQHANLPLGYIATRISGEVGVNLVVLMLVKLVINAVAGRTTEMVLSVGGRRG